MREQTRLERVSTTVLGNLEALGRHVEHQIAALKDGWHLDSVSVDCYVDHIRSFDNRTVRTQTVYTATVRTAKESDGVG